MQKQRLCIVGLGYVGLPLAYAFAKQGYEMTGFDVSDERIRGLLQNRDATNELTEDQLKSVSITYTTDASHIAQGDIVILALPTPVDEDHKPDLSLLEAASRTVGKHMKKGSIIVYESTVYPGVTEDICGKILEQESGMVCGTDFTLGYSPERINPGDKEHTVETIVKIVAGQDERTLETLATLYGSIVKAGIHRAPSIRVAEMAKAIENAQRDLNIAFMNEIAMLCHKLNIRTKDVLEAASTKWNFLRFTPGLVGGHCIGVDPYYLVEVAKQHDMTTRIITAGRAINDGMAEFVAQDVLQALPKPAAELRILVLGLTFKENVPDTRNSKSADVIRALHSHGCTVETHDPYVSPEQMRKNGLTPGALEGQTYDAIVLLVPHAEYMTDISQVLNALTPGGMLYDVKSAVDRQAVENAARTYASL